MYINPRLITPSLQANCGCAADVVCCTPSFSLCDATRTVSDTEMDLFRAVDCVAMCLKRTCTFQNKHRTLLCFSAKPPSTIMASLLLLLGHVVQITFRHALPV